MLEQQLLETAHVSSMASNRSSSMEYTDDEEGGHHASHPDDISTEEVEALREENEAIMKVRLRCPMNQLFTLLHCAVIGWHDACKFTLSNSAACECQNTCNTSQVA